MEPKEPARSPRMPTKGTQTATVVECEEKPKEVLTLVLEPRRHVQWDESVVNNENMNKKSSKSKSAVTYLTHMP